MVFAVERLCDIETLPVEPLRFAKTSSFKLDGAKINQIVRYMGMTLAVKFAVHGEHSLVQRFGNVIVPRIKMAIRQFRQGG